jgi:hypothetical protein
LFLAAVRCGGKPEVRGREAREISITIHQTGVAISLDRPATGRRKGASQDIGGPNQLRFAMERLSWQDGEAGRLEHAIQEIAVEVATAAEISYRESCVREFEWRVRRKTELEEEARQRQLELEREERERLRQLEQARIDRLLDEAAYVG